MRTQQQVRTKVYPLADTEPITDETKLPPFARYGKPPQPPSDDASPEEFDEWMRASMVYARSYWVDHPQAHKSIKRSM